MKIAKKIGYILLSLIALLAIYVVFLLLRPDEPLNPAAEAFYQLPRVTIPDEQNASLALTGIDAPAGVDPLEHAKRIRKILAEARDSGLAGQKGRPIERRDVVLPQEIHCWLDSSSVPRKESKDCASPDRLAALILQSSHLARYKEIQALNGFDQVESYRGNQLINLNKLLAAEIRLDVEQGRSELAYQKWLKNHRFLTRLSAAGGTWVIASINLVDESISFYILDELLRRAPALIAAHQSELTALHSPGGIERFNLDGIMRAEGNLVRHDLDHTSFGAFRHPNYLMNRQYEYAQALVQAARTNPTELERNVKSVTRNFGEVSLASLDFTNLFNGLRSRLYVQGQLKVPELLLSMHANVASERLTALRVQIVMTKKSDAEIEAFLQAAPPELRNPFDGKPMRWDPAKRTIGVAIPGSSLERTIAL